MRNRIAAFGTAAIFLLLGYGMGQASDRAETMLTVTVTSADHELREGYFSLGDEAMLMVRSGTDLQRFLSSQRNRQITIRLSEIPTRQLSRLHR